MNKSIDEIKADYHLFIDIQTGKYLKSKNKTTFDNETETKQIMRKIIEAYNDKIASDHFRLDNLDKTAKISWFNSVEIDFHATEIQSVIPEGSSDLNILTSKLLSHFNELFPFLPDASILHLMNATPALKAIGYPVERFVELLDGKEPSIIEVEILEWAYEVAFETADSFLEKDEFTKDKKLFWAIRKAEKKLDEDTAAEVVSHIYNKIAEDFSAGKPIKRKSKRKPGKK